MRKAKKRKIPKYSKEAVQYFCNHKLKPIWASVL